MCTYIHQFIYLNFVTSCILQTMGNQISLTLDNLPENVANFAQLNQCQDEWALATIALWTTGNTPIDRNIEEINAQITLTNNLLSQLWENWTKYVIERFRARLLETESFREEKNFNNNASSYGYSYISVLSQVKCELLRQPE